MPYIYLMDTSFHGVLQQIAHGLRYVNSRCFVFSILDQLSNTNLC